MQRIIVVFIGPYLKISLGTVNFSLLYNCGDVIPVGYIQCLQFSNEHQDYVRGKIMLLYHEEEC